MAEHYFHHPNSPFRDDELYIPVLEYFVSSPLPDTLEKARPSFLLNWAYKNRVGSPATDFHFEQAFSNKQETLYRLKAPFILLFFIHPECQACMGVTQEILSSVFITHLVENNQLIVLTLYPEEDVESWLRFLPQLPPEWLHAHNPDNEIYSKNLYNLNAIPSLYLLDEKKEILVKDAVSVRQLEKFFRKRHSFVTLRPATQRIHESKSQIVHIINVLLTCLGLTAQTPDSLAVAVGDTLQEQRIDSLALHTVDSLRIPQFDAEGKQIPDSLGYIYHLDSLGYIKIDSLRYFMIDSLATFSKKK